MEGLPCDCDFFCSKLYCPRGDLHTLTCDNGAWRLFGIQWDTHCLPAADGGSADSAAAATRRPAGLSRRR
jgi:hypothetical protein